MKKIILVLFLSAIIFTSCHEYYHDGRIYQHVFTVCDDYYLNTVVNYDGSKISNVNDLIDINKPDEVEIIKTKRYSEAIALIDKLRAIDKVKVSKK